MNEHAGHRSRLRENFIQNGIEGMADHQVLELLLTYALPRVDVNPLAHRLLSRFLWPVCSFIDRLPGSPATAAHGPAGSRPRCGMVPP